MKTGLIVAIETDSIFDYYKDWEALDAPSGFDLYKINTKNGELYVLHTGMGEIAAAAGVQFLVSGVGVERVINFGVVGGLTEEMQKSKVCAVERVVHYKYDCSEFMDLKPGQLPEHDSIFLRTDKALLNKALSVMPELKKVTCCSGDKFVGTAEEKSSLHKNFEGDICDMESAGIVLACEINNIPCLMLKAVSDGLTGGANEFYAELKKVSDRCLEVTDAILAEID